MNITENHEILCVTCGFMWEYDWSDDQAEDEHMSFDGAHYPNWSDTPSEELDIIVSLEDTGRLPSYLR